MPFGTITVNSKSFEPRSPGTYSLSSVVFGDPNNDIRVNPGRLSKDGLVRGSVSRILEKDVTVGGSTVRRQMTLTVSWSAPPSNFTAAEIDGALSDVSEFATPTTISRVNQGEA